MSRAELPLPPSDPSLTLRKTKSTETFGAVLKRKASLKTILGFGSSRIEEHPSLRPDSRSSTRDLLFQPGPPPKKRRWRPGRRSSEMAPPMPPVPRPYRAAEHLDSDEAPDEMFTLDTDLSELTGIVDPVVLHSAASSPDSGLESALVTSHSPTLSGHSQQVFFNNPWLTPTDVGIPKLLHGDAIAPTEVDFKTPDSWHSETYSPRGRRDSEGEASSDDENHRSSRVVGPRWKIRVFADNTEHLLRVSTHDTVETLMPQLNAKLSDFPSNEVHELYLKQWGTERRLRKSERPADILRKCLLKAGYDETDGYELHGSGVPFLVRFVYRSQFLGSADDAISSSSSFIYTNLTGRSLTTIPILLHHHAPTIRSLILSRNPLGTSLPSDFLQACTSLQRLSLSHMYLKKVPPSIRTWRSASLTHLDLSNNRLTSLDGDGDIWLHELSGLLLLQLQNNRLDSLPALLPLGLLQLSISNNRFTGLPLCITQLPSLSTLDVSHNVLTSLPAEIGQLGSLTQLVMACNRISELPSEFSNLVNLRELDCRRNDIADFAVACGLPELVSVTADHNTNLHTLALNLGPNLQSFDISHNVITELALMPGPLPPCPFALTSLDMSYTNLAVLPASLLPCLPLLRTLLLHHNCLHTLPAQLSACTYLETLSVAANHLTSLPGTIGLLQKLEVLDVHGNSLTELPQELWNCASLARINATSNLLRSWWDPPPIPIEEPVAISPTTKSSGLLAVPPSSPTRHNFASRRPSLSRGPLDAELPPLVHSLETLCLAENELTDEALLPMLLFKELRVINLSLNALQEVPPDFFVRLNKLEEVFLSGNRLTRIPSAGLSRLERLGTLFLNGNRLSHLPQELGKVKSLTLLDVGNNGLKYNINNLDYDWNWNFNKNLVFLNLSGNRQLEIKSDPSFHPQRLSTSTASSFERRSLSGFSGLPRLRVLGLMDVTITTNTGSDIPDESEERRVRTSSSLVNGLSYGIADIIGRTSSQHPDTHMSDLVHEFRGAKKDTVFAMFGRAQPHVSTADTPPSTVPGAPTANSLAKFLKDNFIRIFISQLNALDQQRAEGVSDALRRAFLKLNQEYHDVLFGPGLAARKMSIAGSMGNPNDLLQIGASGIVVYIVNKRLYVANAGNALAVVSRDGIAQSVSRKHCPEDRSETTRIRSTGGWVSPSGLVNGELDISRSFGFYHLTPSVNARPDVCELELTNKDAFIIIANRGLWDHVEEQTAVDIVQRTPRDPMLAAQKLRDLAMSCGAEGSTMIMVVSLASMFKEDREETEATEEEQSMELERYRRQRVFDRTLDRLRNEVPAPVGHIALVFTDIKGSTHLWEASTSGMIAALHLHNNLLRRYLRHCGGYEVRTEGDAFICSFPTVLAAVWWCLTIQVELLGVSWPQDILECPDGRVVHDSQGQVMYRGLCLRMGIHCGEPDLCIPDPISNRMDYFGLVVTRASRITGFADGGQITISDAVLAEINGRVFEREIPPEYPNAPAVSKEVIASVKALNPTIVSIGERRLKNLEAPESISYIFPGALAERATYKDVEPADTLLPTPSISVIPPPTPIGPESEFNTKHISELAMLCARLEFALAGRPYSNDLEAFQQLHVLLPTNLCERSEAELTIVLDSLAIRMENVEALLAARVKPPPPSTDSLIAALHGLDQRTLSDLLARFS
ncbi:Adenylate cyclase [Mycena kentingensis (nom. inval.)]|nr:Adenylate cyclase [Mycena kentingensis (nom. inval.)]